MVSGKRKSFGRSINSSDWKFFLSSRFYFLSWRARSRTRATANRILYAINFNFIFSFVRSSITSMRVFIYSLGSGNGFFSFFLSCGNSLHAMTVEYQIFWVLSWQQNIYLHLHTCAHLREHLAAVVIADDIITESIRLYHRSQMWNGNWNWAFKSL